MKLLFTVFLFSLLTFISTGQSYASEANLNPQVIYIPKLSLFLPVQTSPIIDGEWQINEDKTAFFGEHSSLPGQAGTTVVFAYAKIGLFAHLVLLKPKDTITIATKTSIFVYKITRNYLVYPQDISFIKTEGENKLAIFTCFGKNDTKRIVYFGELIKTAPFPKTNSIVYSL